MNFVKNFQGRISSVWSMMASAINISFLPCLFLLLANTGARINLLQAFGLFDMEWLYDVGVAGAIGLLLLVQLWFQNNFIYRKKVRPFVIAAFVVLNCFRIAWRRGVLCFFFTLMTLKRF